VPQPLLTETAEDANFEFQISDINKMIGSFTFVLHSHLPYVINHGEWPHGTDWLYEAAAETYLPLWRELRSLIDDGLRPAVTLGLTPILMEQLAHPRFRAGFKAYLQQKIAAAEADARHFQRSRQPALEELAEYWRELYGNIREDFQALNGDLLRGFRALQEAGGLEIITSAATHGYLPLLGTDESVAAQIAAGVQTYRRHLGRPPRGIWLPECAYRPAYEWTPPTGGPARPRSGVEELVAEQGLEYFIVNKHLILGGESRGVYLERYESLQLLWQKFQSGWNPPPEQEDRTLYQPYWVASPGNAPRVAVFGRHEETALQVWSGEWGYPGNPAYLEFHKKHFPGGHRYWRVTGREADLAEKEIYRPEWIEPTLEEQADHYVELLAHHLRQHRSHTGERGIIVAPFDTELFGHWWHEGPRWLGKVLRRLDRLEIAATSCGSYLEAHPPATAIALPEGSWGQGGFHYIWLNEWTEWTWKEIYLREERFREFVTRAPKTIDGMERRLLAQMARELLLLESSDWQFLISTWSARDYAEQRVQVHAERFDELATLWETYRRSGSLSASAHQRLKMLEREDAPFPDIDPGWWRARPERPAAKVSGS
jgi:1,4-alpha-glucan branching enzyme